MKAPRPKARFCSRLAAVWVSDEVRRLIEPLQFYSAVLERVITVPAGFECDLGSVPRIPFAYLLFGGVADEAAALHDWLYSGRERVTRKQADAVFHEAMKASGTAAWRRYPMTWAVRLFGGAHYVEREESIAP